MIYDLGIRAAAFAFRIGSSFNEKAKKFVEGRKELVTHVETTFSKKDKPVIWMHCASLGEFEQGRPVLEKLKTEYGNFQVVLTFFSPSGYELRKNYAGADYVFYLPWDTRQNAERFVSAINPHLAIFVKYEFWYHYSDVLRTRDIPLISVSSIFRPDQMFFKPYGGFYRRILNNFSWFFVQNDSSLRLLKSIGVSKCSVSGDTRFDRVKQIVERREPIPIAESFKGNERVMVVGSCWPEDMAVLLPLINEGNLKFIIAPHEISEDFIAAIEKSLTVRSVRYSRATTDSSSCSVLIIDNIGMLSRLYQYGEFAFVGGAFGKGLHNVLEAACYGIPIFFGNRSYTKFQEAIDLINLGGAFEVGNYNELKEKFETVNQPENFMLACEVTKQYVENNLGATERIMNYCRNVL